jgi:predicted nuclease of predicted toxin-antitoxin system
MKLLLDTCVWGGAKKELEAQGLDVVWGGDWDTDPGDEEILGLAFSEGRVLVTLDKDFGRLAIHHGHPHCGIVRLVDLAAKRQAAVCSKVLQRYGSELQAGAIVTVEPGRVRVRPPDAPEE